VYSYSLQLAIAYRDHLSQEIIDRNVAITVKDMAGHEVDSNETAAKTAFAPLNDGWGWQNRSKSK
jgi:hypothetical protein